MVKCLQGKTYEELLTSLGLFTLKKRRLRGDLLTEVFNILIRGSRGASADLFSPCCDRTQVNGLKLSQGKFRLDIRKRFFTQRMFGDWNRVPRKAVTAPSLSDSRNIWTMHSGTWCDSWRVLCRARSWTQ